MLHRRLLMAAGLCIALAACEAPTPIDTRAAAAPAAQTPAKGARMDTTAAQPIAPAPASSTNDLGGLLKAGKPYADVRASLIAQGWQPVRDAQCRANVVGGEHETLCAENPGLAGCKACDELPELSSSSGDGYSLMRLSHADGRGLKLTAYGMLADGLVSGADSRLELWTWSVEGENAAR